MSTPHKDLLSENRILSALVLQTRAGLIVAGGGNGELYIGALADSSQSSLVPSSDPSFSSPQIQWSHTTKLSTASINNSLLITRNDLTPSGPLPDLTNGHPRLFVSNNDESIKVFNISVSGATQGRMVPAGSIRVGTPVNHSKFIFPLELCLSLYFLKLHSSSLDISRWKNPSGRR